MVAQGKLADFGVLASPCKNGVGGSEDVTQI